MINQWHRDAASVVGARVICWYVIPVTLSRTPSWNGWHDIYRAAHQLNLLEPIIVLFVNRVPQFLQRCEDYSDIPYCRHNILCLCLEATSEGSQYPKHLFVTTSADTKSVAVIASSRPLESLMESVDHFRGPSSQMLSMHVTTDRCIF